MNNGTHRAMTSEYMQWAKLNLRARYNLGLSGVMNYPLAELPVAIEDLEITGPSYYGYAPLQAALAARYNVPEQSIVAATGTSMANHLVMAALLEPGDEVLIEQPTYEPLIRVAEYLGASIKRFARHADANFRIDPSDVAEQVSSKTRLIILTNLHNPTCAFTDKDTLLELGSIARRVGAYVLVDEVYLDVLFERSPGPAFFLGDEFISTSSLTKVYGLGGLRCGWIFAEPGLAERIWRLNDLFGVLPSHTAERLSIAALNNLDSVAARSARIIGANREHLVEFLRSRDDLEWREPEHGTVSFPRLRSGDVDQLYSLLVEKYETSIVPGKYFEMPQNVRIGFGGDTDDFQEGLNRLGAALDQIR